MLALEFPPVSHLLEWNDLLFKDTLFAVNKVVIVNLLAVVCTLTIFFLASKKRALVPTGVQNVAEASVDFVRNDVVLQVMGPEGLPFLPFMLSIFFYVLFNNLFGIIPFFQMPANARMATPLFLALVVWVVYNVMGIKSQGPVGYFKSALVPPGVPKAMLPLVSLIELLQLLLIKPFSLAVRLFANILAGHLLLVTFAVLASALFTRGPLAIILPLPFLMLIALTGFELLVALLQAFIFTILAAVYIGGAMHPEH